MESSTYLDPLIRVDWGGYVVELIDKVRSICFALNRLAMGCSRQVLRTCISSQLYGSVLNFGALQVWQILTEL